MKTYELSCETRFRIYKKYFFEAKSKAQAIKMFIEKINRKKVTHLKAVEVKNKT